MEFCHAWIKSKLGLRQFHVRGLAKAQTGNAVGLPHIQPAALDSPKQVPRNTSGHLREQDNTEENRVTLSTRQIGVPETYT